MDDGNFDLVLADDETKTGVWFVRIDDGREVLQSGGLRMVEGQVDLRETIVGIVGLKRVKVDPEEVRELWMLIAIEVCIGFTSELGSRLDGLC